MNQEIKLQGDLDIARGALTQTPSGEINRAMRALGGARGVFGEFLREQLVEVRDEIARMPEEATRREQKERVRGGERAAWDASRRPARALSCRLTQR